jgi:hypothetical protein
MIRRIRIFLWHIVSNLEQVLYPFNSEDSGDYYYTVKNDETGENYMIIEWIKSFDERIVRLQDEMVWIKYKIMEIEKED